MRRWSVLLFSIAIIYVKTTSALNNATKAENSNANFLETKVNCTEKKCISKCCPQGVYATVKECRSPIIQHTNLNFSVLPLYNENQERTGKYFSDVYNIVPGRFANGTFTKRASDYSSLGYKFYLTENGTVYVEMVNQLWRWHEIRSDDFCIDFFLRRNRLPELRYWVIIPKEPPLPYDPYLKFGLLVSCSFLLIVLVVYAFLPELRNLNGLVQMSYVGSLFAAFLLLAIQQFAQYPAYACLGFTYLIYFFFLVSCCWVNVMSWDIWSAFRGSWTDNHRWRHGHWSKFGIYCIYAFGLPLAMTIMLIILNHVNMRHLPWFVTPNIIQSGCFLGGEAKLLYLYTPMMFLIIFNLAMYLLTCDRLCQQYENTAVLDSAAANSTGNHRTLKKKFMVFVKLFIIMGLNWSLEVISSLFPGSVFWYISDVWNMLMGFLIFLITVGTQRRTKRKLMKRFRTHKESWSRSRSHSQSSRSHISSSSSNTLETDVSQDTPLRVCLNPEGLI